LQQELNITKEKKAGWSFADKNICFFLRMFLSGRENTNGRKSEWKEIGIKEVWIEDMLMIKIRSECSAQLMTGSPAFRSKLPLSITLFHLKLLSALRASSAVALA
jgi:hypothetical protein